MQTLEIQIDASLVYKHGIKKIKKGRNPSMSFLGIKNPKIAFQKAELYWVLINNLLLKLQQSGYSFTLESPKKVPDYVVRVKNRNSELRNGHLDFYIITENGKIIDLDFKIEKSFYFFSDYRYCLKDLKNSIIELNKSIKIVYVILFSPSIKLTIVHFEQFSTMEMDFYSIPRIPFLSKEKDDIELQEERNILWEEKRWKEISKRREAGEIVHICPNCTFEWNNSYCHYCGHPH